MNNENEIVHLLKEISEKLDKINTSLQYVGSTINNLS